MYRAVLFPLLALVLAACDVGQEHHSEPQHHIMPGDPFPEVVLPGLDRDDLSISQLRGKVVVLNVWATWCAPCRRELPSLQRLGEQLDGERFAVVSSGPGTVGLFQEHDHVGDIELADVVRDGAGRAIAIDVWRNGKTQTFTLKTEAMPE